LTNGWLIEVDQWLAYRGSLMAAYTELGRCQASRG
jgi:hypothetical protein